MSQRITSRSTPADQFLSRRDLIRYFGAGTAGLLLANLAEKADAQGSTPALFHPLNGQGRLGLAFGADWTFEKCGGQWKKHCGVDLMCPAGTSVYAPFDGIVKARFMSSQGWMGCLILEHKAPGNFVFTTTLWHVDVTCGSTVVRGQKVGTVANLQGKSSNHLHFGLRNAAYTETAKCGALPVTATCDTRYPAFPEKFVRPL